MYTGMVMIYNFTIWYHPEEDEIPFEPAAFKVSVSLHLR